MTQADAGALGKIFEERSRSTGKERDAESGNDYFDARYFGSSMGRFLSPDPLGGHTEDPQTLKKYSYVANNPLVRTDPTGLDFSLSCAPVPKNTVYAEQSSGCGRIVPNKK